MRRAGRQIVARRRRASRGAPSLLEVHVARGDLLRRRRRRRGAWRANSGFGVTPTAVTLQLVDLDAARRRGGSCTRARARRGSAPPRPAASVERPVDGHRERAPLAEVAHVDRCAAGVICASGTPSCSQPLARLGLELLELRLELAPGRRRPSAVRNISARSWRMSTSRQPSADVMPGFGGTSTVGIDSSRASAAPCSGPAPPKTTSANSRGS